jgi:hypothetical protein
VEDARDGAGQGREVARMSAMGRKRTLRLWCGWAESRHKVGLQENSY